MPFEPLRTDEKIENPSAPERDMDSQMLAGCSSFVVVSVLGYLLTVWPFFAFGDTWRMASLFLSLAVGALPAAVLGAVAARRTGLPGACGHVGGAMTAGVFLFLRLEQIALGHTVKDLPMPDYPATWSWMVPLGLLLASFAVAVLFLRRDTFADENPGQVSR